MTYKSTMPYKRGVLETIDKLLKQLWLACEQGDGKEGEEEREPVGMAKVFDFHMPVIYVMFKLYFRVPSTITTA